MDIIFVKSNEDSFSFLLIVHLAKNYAPTSNQKKAVVDKLSLKLLFTSIVRVYDGPSRVLGCDAILIHQEVIGKTVVLLILCSAGK